MLSSTLFFSNFLREIELMIHMGARGSKCRITTNVDGWGET
jgi:hypothetical protein